MILKLVPEFYGKTFSRGSSERLKGILGVKMMKEYRVLKNIVEQKVFDETILIEEFRIIEVELDQDEIIIDWEAEFLINKVGDILDGKHKQYERMKNILENVHEAFKKPILVHANDEDYDLREVEDSDVKS